MEKTKNNILEVSNVYKKIRKKQILDDVSLQVKEGEILGLIGPNGAGKTTLIKLALGLQKINSGEIKINGYDIQKDFENAIRKVSAIVENPDMYMYLTGRKNLILNSRLYSNVTKEDIDSVIEMTGLSKVIDNKVSKYSLGMRQRLGIASALLHKPNLLILDEPTNGLDPAGMKELRILLAKISREQGVSILISSHNLHEIENLCDSICILQNGKVLETVSIKEMEAVNSNAKFTFTFDSVDEGLKDKVDNILSKIFSEDNMVKASEEDTDKMSVITDRENIPMITKAILNEGINIYGIEQEKISLEDAFIGKTGGNIID